MPSFPTRPLTTTTAYSSAACYGLKFGRYQNHRLRLTPEYRFYLSDSKPALEGFYFAPFVRYQNLTLTVADTYANGSAMEGKAPA